MQKGGRASLPAAVPTLLSSVADGEVQGIPNQDYLEHSPSNEVVTEIDLGIVLYTFGCDYMKALDLLHALGVEMPAPTNFYFIARSTDSEEIWAFPMPQDPIGEEQPSPY